MFCKSLNGKCQINIVRRHNEGEIMIRINRYAAGSFALSVLVAILLTTACDPENNETDEPASEPTRHATDEGGGETAT